MRSLSFSLAVEKESHKFTITGFLESQKKLHENVRDGRGSYFFHGAGRAEARQKIYGRARESLLPHNAGRGGEGLKICGVGRGRGGEHTACIS